jgi:phospholipid transport system substrate-binding protein
MQAWYRYIFRWVLVGSVFSVLLASHVTRADAGEPLDKVRQTVDNVLTIVNNKALQPQERHAQIRQAVLQRFGFEEMAQRAMGQHWRTLTPQQRQEFVELFTDLLERSYINRIANYKAGPQGIRYPKEDVTDDHAVVHTEIMSERDPQPAKVDYHLLHKDSDWKAYDIVIEGVSLVNNYRTQFNTIILKDSYAGLVKQMRTKLAQEQAVSDKG